MKKFLLAIVVFINFTYAQDFPKNEVKYNIFNTLLVKSVEVGYERLIDFHQSVEFVMLFNDRMNYQRENSNRSFNTNSFKIGYNYYFGTYHACSGLYANPFVKFRFGDFQETGQPDVNMNAFLLGLGAGYKWNTNDKFVFGPFFDIARNFGEEASNRFQGIEFNTGVYIGYRF